MEASSVNYVAEIVRDSTGKVERKSKPMSKSMAERCARGMGINLDHERFTVRVVPVK
jgi:hypothetical protein